MLRGERACLPGDGLALAKSALSLALAESGLVVAPARFDDHYTDLACVAPARIEGMTDARVPKVTFLGKPGCHLCEDAEPVVRAVAARRGAELTVLSILDDEALQRQYGELIPVVLVDGVQHSQWFVEAERLDAAVVAAASAQA